MPTNAILAITVGILVALPFVVVALAAFPRK